jgi:hypothetical protein
MTTSRFIAEATACALAVALIWLASVWPALPHEATNVQGYPLGWDYDPGCCRSAQQPTGDCAPIASEYVTERPDGYHIDIPVGGHPKLITKGYSGIVPYGQERPSPEGNYHICLTTDGAHRFCFYAGSKGF